MAKKLLQIRFPLGGLERSASYQQQQPFTTPDCSNVRPQATLEGRVRGGSRPGLNKAFSNRLSVTDPIRSLSEVNTIDSAGLQERILVALAGDSLFYSNGSTMTAIGGQLETESGVGLETESGSPILLGGIALNANLLQMHATQRGQKLYIADYEEERVSGSDGLIASSNQLSATGVPNWSNLNIDTDTDVAVVWPVAASSVEAGTYAITSVTNSHIVLDATLTGGNCNYRVERCPKVFDPSNSAAEKLIATSGQAPGGCPFIATYRDRIVLAGGANGPAIVYFSRQGDPLDWDYGGDVADAQRALAFTSANAGQVGDAITALMPHGDDHLVIGCEHSLWVLRGDPAYDGQLDNLSRVIGVVFGSAWCETPEGVIVFLSRDGVYVLGPGAGGRPEPWSRDRLPNELRDVDVKSNTVTMSYDVRGRGIHLYISPNTTGTPSHWWLDWQSKGFWPVTLQTGHDPFSVTAFAKDLASQRPIMIGCRDGYIRKYDESAVDDDGSALNSHLVLGPLRLGGEFSEGMLSELTGELATGSGSVTWNAVGRQSAEESADDIVAGQSDATGTLSANRNYNARPRTRGGSFCLKLSSTARWAMEGLLGVTRTLGKQRKP